MQTPIDARLAQSGPYCASPLAAGTGEAELSTALISMDSNATPFDDHIYGAPTFNPGDDLDSFLSIIDPQLSVGAGLGALDPQSAAPRPAGLEAGHETHAYAIKGAAAAQAPRLSASSNLHHPATPLLNAHPGAGYSSNNSSNTPQVSHVRRQQHGAVHHGQGWRGNPLHPHAHANITGYPSSMTVQQQTQQQQQQQQRMAGYPNAQSHPQYQRLQYQDNQWQQLQAHHLSTGENAPYRIAPSAAQTDLAASPPYQHKAPRGQQLHQMQAFSPCAQNLHPPAPPMYNGSLNGFMAEYPAHDPFSALGFGATFPYGQHPSTASCSHADAHFGGSEPASSYLNQFPECTLSHSAYPTPDIVTQQTLPYGNLNTDSSLQGYAQTQARYNGGAMSHPRNNARGNGPANGAEGSKGSGQRYPGENQGGDMAGSDDSKQDPCCRDGTRDGTVQMAPPTGLNEPPATTAPPVRVLLGTPHLNEPKRVLVNGVWMRQKGSENGRVPTTRQSKNQQPHLCDPRLFYRTLPKPPLGFGNERGIGLHQFRYSSDVQLADDLKYSAEDIAKFLKGRDGQITCKLRVQATPSQVTHRLAKEDRRCRWKDCPIPSRNIASGWYRVAFDEFPRWTDNGLLDPYHMAGVMHLWCFEQCFDLVDLSTTGRLVAEDRTLDREEKNLMSLTRDSDHAMIKNTYFPWFMKRREKDVPHTGPWKPRPHKDSLSYVLTRHHLDHQTKARHTSRNNRRAKKAKTHGYGAVIEPDGGTIDVHQGDLRVYAAAKHPRYNPRAEYTATLQEVEFNDGNQCFGEPELGTVVEEEDDVVELSMAKGGGDQATACPEELSPLTLYIEQNVLSLVQDSQTADAQRLGHASPKRKREEVEAEAEAEATEEAAGRVSKRARTDHQQLEQLAGQELAGSDELFGENPSGSQDLFGENPAGSQDLFGDDLFGETSAGETLPVLDDCVPATLGEDLDAEYLYGGYDDSLYPPGQEEHHDFACFLDDEAFK